MTTSPSTSPGIIVLVQDTQERVLLDISMAAWRERRSEWGGLLFGRTFAWRGGPVVWVAAAVPGIGSGTPVSFEMEPESYVLAQRLLRRPPQVEGLEEVGFWHSHPHLHVAASRTDTEYHGMMFPAAYSVSIIVDPFAPAAAAYANTDYGIVAVPAYSFAGDALGQAPARRLMRPWQPDEVRDAFR